VDDEESIAHLFVHALKANGYSAEAFTDPLKAYDSICSNHSIYGLVLSDVRMPCMSGIELATKLKTKFKSIKIILMSAFEEEYIKSTNIKNIDYFISKPAHIEKVLGVVESVVMPQKIKIEKK
jgi:two-component system response regulator YesN